MELVNFNNKSGNDLVQFFKGYNMASPLQMRPNYVVTAQPELNIK